MGVGLPAGLNPHQRVIRSHDNPLDKCTVVSICPKEIYEVKPTIQPGVFHIAAGSFEKPSILVVGSSSWWRDTGTDDQLLEIPTGSVGVARAIVTDYCNSLLGFSPNAMPGLFFVHGEKTAMQIKVEFKKELEEAKVRQDNWYKELVSIADQLWARSNGNPLTISDDARLAAQELGLAKDKPWMQDFNTLLKVNCPACGFLIPGDFPVCGNCKTVINPEKFKALGLKFAS